MGNNVEVEFMEQNSPTIRMAGLIEESTTDGPGIRFVIFAQGCTRNCPGCHNPHTHSLTGGTEISVEELLQKIESNPLLDGITLSGGEPFLQAKPLSILARQCREHGLNVVTYTGYLLRELREKNDPDIDALLQQTDILIDGPFLQEKLNRRIPYRGSTNQKVHHLNREKEKQKPPCS